MRVPGTENIMLTPEIFANVQEQTRKAIDQLRLYFVMFESLLSSVALKDPRENKKRQQP